MSEDSSDTEEDTKNDPDFSIDSKKEKNNVLKITSTAITAIATHISDRTTADLLNAFQLDKQLSDPTFQVKQFNNNKVFRWKSKIRKTFYQKNLDELQSRPIISILYDSKLENQLTNRQNERETFSRAIERQDHFTVVVQPANKFATSISLTKPVN